jgi:hypothetical protein
MASFKELDPLSGNVNKYRISYTGKKNRVKTFKFNNLKSTLASNGIFSKDDISRYNKFSRFGYIDPYNTDQVIREFLFFTKPDLYLYEGSSYNNVTLNSNLINIPFFVDANRRCKDALLQLQYSVTDSNGSKNPFMYLLSNTVTSKLDLPGISADSKESTSNIMGTSIQYRGHSLKSDNGYDFSLSFTDTASLEVYTLLKVYDEYMRLIKTGETEPKQTYIINRIIPEQFSIYKFLIGSDGETILYYAKLTGCYFTDVPRSDFGDPGNDGFKFSASFHAQFVEDSNPMILEEFNRISPAGTKNASNAVPTYNTVSLSVDNRWVRFPKIVSVSAAGGDKQVARRGTTRDYRIKWFS